MRYIVFFFSVLLLSSCSNSSSSIGKATKIETEVDSSNIGNQPSMSKDVAIGGPGLQKIITSDGKEYVTYTFLYDYIEDQDKLYSTSSDDFDTLKNGDIVTTKYFLSKNVTVKPLRQALKDIGIKVSKKDTLIQYGRPIDERYPAYISSGMSLSAKKENGKIYVESEPVDKESYEVVQRQNEHTGPIMGPDAVLKKGRIKSYMFELVTSDGKKYYALDALTNNDDEASRRLHRVNKLPKEYQSLVWEPTMVIRLKPGVKVLKLKDVLKRDGITVNVGDTIMYNQYITVSDKLPALITSGTKYKAEKKGKTIRIRLAPLFY